MWLVTLNMLIKQSKTTRNGSGEGHTAHQCNKARMLQSCAQALRPGQISLKDPVRTVNDVCPRVYCMIWDMRYEIKYKMPFLHTYPPTEMEQTECSETLPYKIQTLGNYPEESI